MFTVINGKRFCVKIENQQQARELQDYCFSAGMVCDNGSTEYRTIGNDSVIYVSDLGILSWGMGYLCQKVKISTLEFIEGNKNTPGKYHVHHNQ